MSHKRVFDKSVGCFPLLFRAVPCQEKTVQHMHAFANVSVGLPLLNGEHAQCALGAPLRKYKVLGKRFFEQ